jgi:MFS family permease
MGGNIISYGRKSSIIHFSNLAIIACILSMDSSMEIICLGRFLYGLAAGVLLCAAPKIVSETVPTQLID